MPLYHFYRLVPKVFVEEPECYIGHTIQRLSKRLWTHKKEQNCSSNVLFEKYGNDGIQLVLIHSLELQSKEEARREERRLYEEYKKSAVNIRNPHTTVEERKEQHRKYCREWYKKEENKARSKAYYEQHKEAKKAYAKERRLQKKNQRLIENES